MGIFEIISAIILIIACVFIVVVVLMKDTKTQMSQTISGSTADSYYGKNSGRTKDAMLNKATVAATVIFFVLALAVNVINVYFGTSKTEDASSVTSDNAVVDISDLTGTAEADDEVVVPAVGTSEANAATEPAADNSEPAAENSEPATTADAAAEGAADNATAEAVAPAVSTAEASATSVAE